MNLSTDLIDQFVQATNDEKKEVSDGVAYGTVVKDGDKTYVQLDGSTYNTPVATTTNVMHGERVAVLIKNHTVTITGNFSSPADSTSSTMASIDSFNTAVGKKLSVEELTANSAFIEFLLSDKIVAETIIAADAKIGELDADKLTVDDLKAVYGNFDELDAYFAKLGVTEIDKATIKDLNATCGNFRDLHVDYGEFEKIVATKATVGDLFAKNVEAEMINSTALDTKFANVDFANVTELAVNNFFAKSGIIQDLTLENGVVVKELVGVTIKGDLIEAGTLKVDRLVVKGSDGNYYKLSTDFAGMPGVEPVEEDMIHGSTIVANSVTAEKINVSDLTAFGAKIAGFTISNSIPGFNDTVLQYMDGQLVSKGSYYCKDPNDVYLCIQDGAPDSLDDEAYFYKEPCIGAIYSGVKSSVDNDTRGVYLDDIGQVAFGDTNSFVKFYKGTDGTYKLAINASEIILGTSKKNVENAINGTITSVITEYTISDSKDTPPPDSGITGNCNIVLSQNDDGTQILEITDADNGNYNITSELNDDGTQTLHIAGAASWSETPPTKDPEKYVWTRNKTIYSDGTVKYTDPVCDVSWEVVDEVTNGVTSAQTSADSAATVARDAQTLADATKTIVSALSDSISDTDALALKLEQAIAVIQKSLSTMVIDDENTTLLQQDGKSFTFSFATLKDSIADLQNQMANALEHRGYIQFNENDGDPYILISAAATGIKLRLTSTAIEFVDSAGKSFTSIVADLLGRIGMEVDNVTVTGEFRQSNQNEEHGEFVWQVRANGNYGLSWKG